LRAGIEKRTEGVTLVCTRHSAWQFSLRPYSAPQFPLHPYSAQLFPLPPHSAQLFPLHPYSQRKCRGFHALNYGRLTSNGVTTEMSWYR